MRLPYRQRFSIILNEFGTALAGRGAGPQRGDPPRQPGAEGDRPGPEAPRRAEPGARRPGPRLATSVLAPLARAPRAGRRLRRAGRQRRAGDRRRSAPRSRRRSRRLPRFLRRAAPDDAPPRRASPTRRRRCSPTSARRRRTSPASSRRSARSRRPASRRSARSATRPRSARWRSGHAADHQGHAHAGRAPGKPLADNLAGDAREPARHRRHRARAGLPLLPGGGDQRLRLVRPLPARRADRQHVLDLRDQADPACSARYTTTGGATRDARIVARRRRRRLPAAHEPHPERIAAGQDAKSATEAVLGARPRKAAAKTRKHAQGQARASAARRRGRRRCSCRPPCCPAPRRRPRPPLRPPTHRSPPARRRRPTTARPAAARLPARRRLVRRAVRLHRGQPGPDRRGDDARHPRRRLPGLQREQRPAVRADLPAEGATSPTRPTWSRATRSASAARASASSPTSRRCGARTAAPTRPSSRSSSQSTVKPLPNDSTVLVRPRSALGLKYVEITKGTSQQGFDDGATVPLRNAKPAPVEIDEVLNTFDDQTRARRAVQPAASSATRSPAAATTSTRPSRSSTRCCATSCRSCATCPTRARGCARLLPGARARGARSSRRSPRRRPTCSSTSTRPSRRSTRSRPTSRTRSPAARPRSTRRSAASPCSARSWPTASGLFHELRPGVRALRHASGDLADAFEVGTPALRRSVALNQRLTDARSRRCRASPRTRSPRSASTTCTTRRHILNPTLANLRPLQTVCNYITLWFRNVSSLLSEGDANGTWQRFIIVAAPSGPEQRGRPASTRRPTAAAERRQLPAHQPVPEHAGARPADECEAGNEP